MPTLPLYTPTDVPDAWHRVIAPGGYEWWHFDAHSTSGVRLVATLTQGALTDRAYLRQYAQYRRRPTRVRPPVPGDCAAVTLAVYETDRPLARWTTQFPGDEFRASEKQPAVRVGPNELAPNVDGSLLLSLREAPGDSAATARLTFRPRLQHPACEIALSHGTMAAEHRWVVANALCDVVGTLTVAGRDISFTGSGYHDHGYGTAPLSEGGIAEWMRGRVLLEDRACAFHLTSPHARLVEADASGVTGIDIADVELEGRNAASGCPGVIRLGAVLRLDEPRLIDSRDGATWVTYKASYRGEIAEAFCQRIHP